MYERGTPGILGRALIRVEQRVVEVGRGPCLSVTSVIHVRLEHLPGFCLLRRIEDVSRQAVAGVEEVKLRGMRKVGYDFW